MNLILLCTEAVPMPQPPPPPPTIPGAIPGGEGLAEAIQLLSCRPARCSIPQAGHHYMPHWGETHEERMHRRMYPGPASQRSVVSYYRTVFLGNNYLIRK